MTRRTPKTAEELMAELRRDPQFVEREREQEERHRRLKAEYTELERPILEDLRTIGINIPTIGNAKYLEPYMPFSAEVTSVFLRHLPGAHQRIEETLVRLLAAACPFDARVLTDLFDENGDSHLRWLIANALAEARPTGIDKWLVKALQDPLVGRSKEMLMLAAARLLPPEVANPLIMAQIDEYPYYVAHALRVSGGRKELDFLQSHLTDDLTREEQGEMEKAIRAISKRLA